MLTNYHHTISRCPYWSRILWLSYGHDLISLGFLITNFNVHFITILVNFILIFDLHFTRLGFASVGSSSLSLSLSSCYLHQKNPGNLIPSYKNGISEKIRNKIKHVNSWHGKCLETFPAQLTHTNWQSANGKQKLKHFGQSQLKPTFSGNFQVGHNSPSPTSSFLTIMA